MRREPKENGMEDEIISKVCVLEMVLPKLGKTGEWSEQLDLSSTRVSFICLI